jgi:hypothetical protein
VLEDKICEDELILLLFDGEEKRIESIISDELIVAAVVSFSLLFRLVLLELLLALLLVILTGDINCIEDAEDADDGVDTV